MDVEDRTNDDIVCTFVEVPGLEWTTKELAKASGYVDQVIGTIQLA